MLFGKLTVYENLSMGAYTRKNQDEIKKTLDMVYELFPRVRERAEQKAETLSGGRTADGGNCKRAYVKSIPIDTG